MNAFKDKYGEGYFHGANSGYPKEGYQSSHPDWSTHLDCISGVLPVGARILDIGCAYGYFVEQARARGYQAYGVDVSDYALSRKPELSGRLALGTAEHLPWGPATFDLVTAFDVLEHLPDPAEAIEEFGRVLKPDGFLLFGTPDPLKFTGYEPTHINERPPSYWIRLLSSMGFELRFWFYETLFLEVIACHSSARQEELELVHDAFQSKRAPAAGRLRSAGGISLAAREGWRDRTGAAATLYLLNETGAGVSCRIRLSGKGVNRINLSCINPLSTVVPENQPSGPVVADDNSEWIVRCPPIGIELAVNGMGREVNLEQVSVEDVRSWAPDFRALPGDYLSRHNTVAGLLKKLRIPTGSRILDVGGGDSLMALVSPEYDWTVLDMCGADQPGFVRRRAEDPFGDGGLFDAVVSIDVLEHIPPDQRGFFLTRICELSKGPVILAAPFDDPAIRTVESAFAQVMAQLTDDGHKFIEDHVRLGLPELEPVLRRLEELKVKCAVLPGESILYWWESTFYFLALKELAPSMSLAALFARLHNEKKDGNIGTPCYRRYLIAWDDPLVEQLKLEADNEAGSGPATDHLLDECLKIASMGSLYQSRRNLELNKRIMELDRRIMELDSALQTSQAEVVRVTTEWQKLHANHVQALAERDAYHAKYRRLRDFLVTVYQIFPLKFFMPLGPIDPKSGEFRLK